MEENNFLRDVKNETDTDRLLARHYFPMLKELAKNQNIVTYTQFNLMAKKIFPDVEEVQAAIEISLGRRFEYIRLYLKENSLPDLSAWVVNFEHESSKEYKNDFDPDNQRYETTQRNWDLYLGGDWGEPIELSVIALSIMKQRSKKYAEKIMSKYAEKYRDRLNYKSLKVAKAREQIVSRLMDGDDPDEVFSVFLTPEKNKTAD